MPDAVYEVVGREGAWRILHEHEAGMAYATKEAAFEAAAASASRDIKAGRRVVVTVAGADADGETMLGSQQAG